MKTIQYFTGKAAIATCLFVILALLLASSHLINVSAYQPAAADSGLSAMPVSSKLEILLENTPTPSAYLPLVYQPARIPTEWLPYINYLRALGQLPEVTENTSWSDGCWLHSRYMVKNDIITHQENPSNPWYTTAGNAAAQNGNVMVSSSTSASDIYAIDMWMTGPFHGVGIIDPALRYVGFGSYRENIGTWRMGATLDVLRGLVYPPPASISYPVKWPADQFISHFTSYDGNEWPDPLTSCTGYSAPSGPPVYLLLGPGNVTPSVTAHTFKHNGVSLAHCVFDQTNYKNPDSYTQSLGRDVLNMRNAIVLMPKNPLTPGERYDVSITTNGSTYSWQFYVSATGTTRSSQYPAQIR